MGAKAERTRQHILETVAPVFTKMGYVHTSMGVITEATGLSKGAIYGHFDNKESLALEAFNFVIRSMMTGISRKMDAEASPLKQLYAITDYYRGYYDRAVHHWGGCPILSIGIDAKHLNPKLYQRVRVVILKLKRNLSKIIRAGIEAGEIRSTVDSDQVGGRIYAQIEGAIFSAIMLENPHIIDDMLDHIDIMIATELKL